MNILSTFFLASTLLTTAPSSTEITSCTCKECKCTQESHCGCLNFEGCACPKGCKCGERAR